MVVIPAKGLHCTIFHDDHDFIILPTQDLNRPLKSVDHNHSDSFDGVVIDSIKLAHTQIYKME